VNKNSLTIYQMMPNGIPVVEFHNHSANYAVIRIFP